MLNTHLFFISISLEKEIYFAFIIKHYNTDTPWKNLNFILWIAKSAGKGFCFIPSKWGRGCIAQTVTLSIIWYHSRRCLKGTRNLINYLLYVANTGFPAKSKQKDVKITAEEISVWNPTTAFHQSPSVLSALRTTVGKVNTCKQKENLWKIVVKGHEFFICIFKWQKPLRITSVFQIF